jgi:glycosyltransferase involved in cell wall biosynthesis
MNALLPDRNRLTSVVDRAVSVRRFDTAASRGARSGVAVLVISDLEFGGAQRQVVELANHMDERDFRIYVCSLSRYVPVADSLRDGEHRLKFVPRRFRFDFTVPVRLAWFLREVRADIVHAYLFDATIAARLSGRLARDTAVIDSERNTDVSLKRLDGIAYRLTRGLNDLTIANSRAGAECSSQLFHQPINTYRVVHNGVDVERFTPREAGRLRAELGLGAGQPVVGMFASFKPQKNHPFLLRSARKIVQRFPDVRFLFVGDELYKGMSDSLEFKKTIHRLVEELRLRQHCIFVGNRANVEDYYNVCTLTVLPSLFEGTPNVALESMACGVPVVATNVADNSYVIPDGRAGFVVPLGDQQALADRVSTLLGNEEVRATMSTAARAWVLQEFSARRLAEKTAAVYREAIRIKHRQT